MGRRSYLIIACAGVLASACGGPRAPVAASLPAATSVPATVSSAPQGGSQSDAQRQALADGRVTFDEYEAGFLRFKDCLASAGYPLTDTEFDSATQLYQSQIPAAAVEGGEDDSCYRREFQALDMSWQTNRERPGNFDLKVIGWYRACLEKAGVSVPDDKPGINYLDLMHENGLDPLACVREHRGGP